MGMLAVILILVLACLFVVLILARGGKETAGSQDNLEMPDADDAVNKEE